MFEFLRRKPKPAHVELAAKPAAGRNLYADQAIEAAGAAMGRLPDPDEILKRAGLTRAALRVLEFDDELSAALETRRESVVSVPWSLDPYTETDAELFVWNQLERHLGDILRGAWNAIPYGYSVLEAVYERLEGGRVGIGAISEKPLEWFEPTREGGLKYTPPGGGGDAAEVDQQFKFFLTRRNPTYRQPYGESLLSRLYWPWHFRQSGWKWWLRYLERFGDPLLVGQVGDLGQTDLDGKSAADYFVEAVQSQGFASVLGVGRDDSVSSVSHSQAGEFERFEQAIVKRYARIVLGHPDIAMSVSGRLGGDTMAAQIFEMRRAADMRLLIPTVQRVVNALWALNRFPGEVPQFKMQDERGIDAERAARDVSLVQAGILKPTEQYLLSRYDFEEGDFELVSGDANLINAYSMGLDRLARLGLDIPKAHPRELFRIPEPAAGEEVLTPPVAEEDAGMGQFSATQGTVELAAPIRGVREGQRFSADQELVERLAGAAIAESPQPIPPAAIMEAIKGAASPEELDERLAALYRGNDADEFRELMEKALFAADVVGYSTAEKRIGE